MAAVKRSLNVAVVGMGRMGVPIARNVAFKSRTSMYLQLHSRSMQRARKVSDDIGRDGAQCAMRLHNRYSTVTKWSDVVVACLANRDASKFVMLDHDESLVRNARAGQIIVDHTTTDPDFARECEYEARRRGAFYIDAPISGNPQAAHNGQLTIMCGGDADAIGKVQPLLRFYGENITRMGDSGSGAAAKTICQALVSIHTVAAAEAMRMANEMGVEDSKSLVSVLDASWGSSTMLRRNAHSMQTLLRNPETSAPTSSASVGRLLNDLSYVDDVAGMDQVHLPLLDAARRTFEATERATDPERDICSVVQFLDAAGMDMSSSPQQHEKRGFVAPQDPHEVSAAAAAAAAAAASSTSFLDSMGDDNVESFSGMMDSAKVGGGNTTAPSSAPSAESPAAAEEDNEDTESGELEFY